MSSGLAGRHVHRPGPTVYARVQLDAWATAHAPARGRRMVRHRATKEGQIMASWPPILRHLVLLIAAVLLSWAGTDLIPALQGQTGWGSLLAAAIAAVIAYFTPLVQAYGVGRRPVEARRGPDGSYDVTSR